MGSPNDSQLNQSCCRGYSAKSKAGDAVKKILHFYCYTCKDYELKTSPQYRAQKERFTRRRKAEKA